MATSVSMQSPISDYGNFGAVASQNWQSAQERALKEDLTKAEHQIARDTHDLERDKFDISKDLRYKLLDMQQEEHEMKVDFENARRKNLADMKEIAHHKFDVADQRTQYYKEYQKSQKERVEDRGFADYIDIFGIGKDSYWSPEEVTFEEYIKGRGDKMPDYDDFEIDPNLSIAGLQYYKSRDNLDSSVGDTDALMNLIRP